MYITKGSVFPGVSLLLSGVFQVCSSPLQGELRLLLLVLDDLADGLPGGGDAVFDTQVQQVLVVLRGRELVTVLHL